MKKAFIFFLALSFSFACQQDKQVVKTQLQSEIQALEAQLLQNQDASKNVEAAKQLVEKTRQFAKEFPEDTTAATLLFKAAEVARGAGDPGRAVQLWGEVWRKHPAHWRAPMAMFLQGFTCDSDLRNADMARQYYQQFLQQYPNDSLAGQVKQLLNVVDKAPEDLVKEFKKGK